MPGRWKRSTSPWTRWPSQPATRLGVRRSQSSGSHSGRRATTPMFETLPLSPLRAQASRTSGSARRRSRRVDRVERRRLGRRRRARHGAAAQRDRAPHGARRRARSRPRPRACRAGTRSGLISGDTAGRPPPGPVVPGDHEVPAGAISRANISSARRSAWSATTRIITSRAAARARVRAVRRFGAEHLDVGRGEVGEARSRAACGASARRSLRPVRCAFARRVDADDHQRCRRSDSRRSAVAETL